MADWKGIIGKSFKADSFDSYCHTITWTTWRPSFIVLHNTGIPTLGQRPRGFSKAQINGLQSYYRDDLHWNAGPHLFIDDHHIWVFTPLNVSGTHSPSWNKLSLGVEMLGNYEDELFDSGRGMAVRRNTVCAIATLSAVLGLFPDSMKLHREDPLTTHACPGKNVRKLEMIQAVTDLMIKRHAGEHPIKPGA